MFAWISYVHIYWHPFLYHIWWSQKPTTFSRKVFWPILMTFICDVKIEVNMCESHYINLFFFVNLLHSPWFFKIWHLFDNLTSFGILTDYLNHLSPYRTVLIGLEYIYFLCWCTENSFEVWAYIKEHSNPSLNLSLFQIVKSKEARDPNNKSKFLFKVIPNWKFHTNFELQSIVQVSTYFKENLCQWITLN